ncbi:amino acid ABC transporter substrate-binding protein [Agromyces bauzanensis]
MTTTSSRRILAVAAVITGMFTLAGCAPAADGTGGSGSDDPIRIGASLPLSGPVADVAEPGMNGYQLWSDQVNAAGGLLGRPVELVILDDGFDQETVVSNYTKLISEENVDLLLGTFSSKLNLPASTVAERNGMVYVEPSGGASEIFERGYTKLFFAQPGTTESLPDNLVDWIESLPSDERPATAAYLTVTDPNTQPAVEDFQARFEAMGIETVYSDVYPPETSNFDVVADAVKRAAPDMVIQGEVGPDGVDFVRSLQKVGFSPSVLYQPNAPTQGPVFAEGIGEANAEGIFGSVAWTADVQFPGSADFVEAYEAEYDATPDDNAAAPYVAAQVLQAAVEAVGSLDQEAIAEWLHANTVDTVFGPLSWDQRGVPSGSLLLAQWQSGSLEVVAPEEAASSDTIVHPKPAWSN